VLVWRDDRLFPVDWLRRVAIERVGITPTRSMGGHCVALSQPKEHADRLHSLFCSDMRSGLWLPLFEELADPGVVARLAADAEERGWHGVFVWDQL
jgi:hypothetical protein